MKPVGRSAIESTFIDRVLGKYKILREKWSLSGTKGQLGLAQPCATSRRPLCNPHINYTGSFGGVGGCIRHAPA
jgi:hypothetical protein